MKPTIYYVLVAGILAFGLLTDRPLLQRVLGSAYPGLERGAAGTSSPATGRSSSPSWRCSTRRCGATATTDFWIGFKLWGAIPLTFLFAAANIPMLLKHGLMREDAVPAEPGPVE